MKIFAILAATLPLALNGLADGTVQFRNNLTTGIYLYDYATMAVNPVTSATLGSQDGIGESTGVLDIGLVWGTTASSLSTISGGTLVGVTTIGTSPGQFAGQAPNGGGTFPIPGTNPGDTAYFQVYAWDSSFGNTLAGLESCIAANGAFGAASAGFENTVYGAIGAPLELTLGQPLPALGTPLFGSAGNVFGKMVVLSESPEPATLAFGGLGAAVLLLCRRRK